MDQDFKMFNLESWLGIKGIMNLCFAVSVNDAGENCIKRNVNKADVQSLDFIFEVCIDIFIKRTYRKHNFVINNAKLSF